MARPHSSWRGCAVAIAGGIAGIGNYHPPVGESHSPVVRPIAPHPKPHWAVICKEVHFPRNTTHPPEHRAMLLDELSTHQGFDLSRDRFNGIASATGPTVVVYRSSRPSATNGASTPCRRARSYGLSVPMWPTGTVSESIEEMALRVEPPKEPCSTRPLCSSNDWASRRGRVAHSRRMHGTMHSVPDTGDSGAARLLEPLTEEQQWVVDVIAHAFWSEGFRWPTFLYVEAEMDTRDIDLREVLSTFPLLGHQPGLVYSVLSSLPAAISFNENQQLKLSVLGLWHAGEPLRPTARVAVADFIDVLNKAVSTRRNWVPSATVIEKPELTSEEVLGSLRRRAFGGIESFRGSPPYARLLYQLIEHEPSFLGGHSSEDDYTKWQWTIERSALRFQDVASMEQYVGRLAALVRPTAPERRVVASPLDLPTSLGYLDTAWRLTHERKHLLHLTNPERVASLAFDVGGREEFFDRLGALCDTMKGFQVPAGSQNGHPIVRMRGHLEGILPSESHVRVGEAIDILGHLVAIRNGGQHGDAQDRAAQSWAVLGVSLPVTDWTGAWAFLRQRAISAFDVLRDELLSMAD